MKKLNLNRSKLRDAIEELRDEYDIDSVEKPNELYQYKFTKTGEAPASINIYHVKDGSTTLQHKTGSNQQLSEAIAKQLRSRSEMKEYKSHSFYLKAIRNEDFQVLIEFLEEENTVESDKIKKDHRIVKVKGHQGDSLTLHRHSNGSFQAQGKPRLLFNDVIYLLSELLPFKTVIESQLDFYEVHLTSDGILGELEICIPTAWDHLDDKLKSILSPCIVARKIDVELEDYTMFAFPVFRALEGILKQLFKKYEILVSKDGFGEFIINDPLQPRLKESVKEEITDPKVQKAICDIYSYYSSKRHNLFHVDGTIDPTITLTHNEALQIIDFSLKLIEDSFSRIHS